MSPEQAKILMELRGYSVQWTTPGRDTGGFVKEIDDVTIFAQVSASRNNIELEYMCEPPAMCRLSTGQFALNHPHFDKYEAYVVKAAYRLLGL